MIPKLTTGNGFGGSLRYDTRQGQGTKPGLAKVLDVSGVEFDIDKDGNYVINTRKVSRDFRAQTMGYQGKRDIRKPVYHWVLSYHPEDKVSEEQMIEDAKDFLKRIGFDDTQYVMTVHYDKAHHHLHIVTNVVNNQGKRIPTMGLIDKAHEAAAAITKERGYIWGEKTQKQDIKQEKIHDPHDRARKNIEPIIREAKEKATSLDEFKEILETHGISCKITLAQDGKRGGISYAYEYEGMVHPFKGSSIGRELSFSYVDKAIKANYKNLEVKYDDISAGHNSVIPPIKIELISIRNNCYKLYEDTSSAGAAIKAETTEKYNELKSLWKKFHDLNETSKNEKDTVKVAQALGGMLMLLNPVIGLSAIFLASIAGDIRESSQQEQKKRLLRQIESVRKEITELSQKKAQLDIQKKECLKEYLDAKQNYQEYRDGLSTLDTTIYETNIDLLKMDFPFKNDGHIQYIIHGRTDASIFRAEEQGIYREVPSGKRSQYTGKELTEDYYEKARLALKKRNLFVAADRGPEAFYNALLEERKYDNFHVGEMQIHPDGKISFGQERFIGEPQIIEKNVPKKVKTIEKIAAPVIEAPAPKPMPVPAPAPAPQQKPSFEILKTFSCDCYKFRIIKEADNVLKLQQLKPDTKSPVINHRYSREAWFNNAKFYSYEELGRDDNGVYFKIKALDGETRYINHYGVDLSNKMKARLGLGSNNGLSM